MNGNSCGGKWVHHGFFIYKHGILKECSYSVLFKSKNFMFALSISTEKKSRLERCFFFFFLHYHNFDFSYR